MLLRSLLLGAATLAWGVDSEPPLLAFTAAGGMSVSLSPDRPSEASGGVRIRYERVLLDCDRLVYRMSALPGATRPVLASADFAGGEDGRMRFDSMATELVQLAFRGVMRPRQLQVRRLDADPERPEVVRFRAEAIDLGDVDGTVITEAGPRRHVARAERAVLDFVGVADPDSLLGLATPRLQAIHFYGAPGRPAVVLRLAKGADPPIGATVAELLPTGAFGMRASGMTMSLHFDEHGALSGYQSDTGDYELRDGEDLFPRLGGSKPTLLP